MASQMSDPNDMTEPTGPYHHGNLRETVLDYAQTVIESEGLEKLSLRACARAAGVDPAALYRHFRNKDAIVKTLAHVAFIDLAQAMEDALAGTPAHDTRAQLEMVGLTYIRFATERPARFRMMFQACALYGVDAVHGTAASGRNAYDILCDSWTAYARTKGADPDMIPTAPHTMWTTVHGLSELVVLGLLGEGGARTEELAASLFETNLVGLIAQLQGSTT